MPDTNLSRRNLLTRAVTVAAVAGATAIPAAVPAFAAPSAASIPAKRIPLSATSTIDRLWKNREALLREYKQTSKVAKKLERKLERAMPEPHPSIVYSPENDADGLARVVPNLDDSFIWPQYIMAAAMRTPALKLSPAECEARRNRFADRLRLSNRLMRERMRLSKELGLEEAHEHMQDLTARQSEIADRILKARPVKRSDMEKKLALYDYYDDYSDEWCAGRVVRDLRRLFENKIVLEA